MGSAADGNVGPGLCRFASGIHSIWVVGWRRNRGKLMRRILAVNFDFAAFRKQHHLLASGDGIGGASDAPSRCGAGGKGDKIATSDFL